MHAWQQWPAQNISVSRISRRRCRCWGPAHQVSRVKLSLPHTAACLSALISTRDTAHPVCRAVIHDVLQGLDRSNCLVLQVCARS